MKNIFFLLLLLLTTHNHLCSAEKKDRPRHNRNNQQRRMSLGALPSRLDPIVEHARRNSTTRSPYESQLTKQQRKRIQLNKEAAERRATEKEEQKKTLSLMHTLFQKTCEHINNLEEKVDCHTTQTNDLNGLWNELLKASMNLNITTKERLRLQEKELLELSKQLERQNKLLKKQNSELNDLREELNNQRQCLSVFFDLLRPRINEEEKIKVLPFLNLLNDN